LTDLLISWSQFDPINPDNYKVYVVKSRVHFQGGFDETGYAKTIFVVDALAPWFGTILLNALNYEFEQISGLYPFDGQD
jgi:microcystin degradation protein MlrC